MGAEKFGLDHIACRDIASSIKEAMSLGVQIGLVIGGGNIFRGAQARAFGFKRSPADQMGMLATMINGMALEQVLTSLGLSARVMSSVPCPSFMDSFRNDDALRLLEDGGIPIFAGGTGNPYFTTDTAAALRASEMGADILFKATKVEGVFDKDPVKHKDAKHYKRLSYKDALNDQLDVMDATALALCRENKMPILVFNIFAKGALLKAIQGADIGSLITEE